MCSNLIKPSLLCIMVTALTACSNGNSTTTFDCSKLVGTWSGQSYSEKWERTNTFVQTFLPQGLYNAYFQSRSKTGDVSYQADQRTWFCDGTTFGTFLIITSDGLTPENTIAPHKVFEFIELTDSTLKYKTLKGNEVGKTYEASRIK